MSARRAGFVVMAALLAAAAAPQMAWFAKLYDLVMRGLAWAHAMVDPIKRRVRKYVHMLRPRNAGRFYRHLMRVRRRMQHAAPAA